MAKHGDGGSAGSVEQAFQGNPEAVLKHRCRSWVGRLKPWYELSGQQVLCIGCLEQRIGRTLTARDFADVPVNGPDQPNISDRMRDRLTTR